MNPSQLVTVASASLLVLAIVVVVVRYEIRARRRRAAFAEADRLSQEIAVSASADPIVGQWTYTDSSLGGLKAFSVDAGFLLTGDMYGAVQLTVISPGLYSGVFRAGDPPTKISVVGDVATMGTNKFARLKN